MDVEKRERLEQLKRENKERQRKEEIENNVLLSECKAALGTDGQLLGEEEKQMVYHVFKEKVPFLPWGIDWKLFQSFYKTDKIERC